MHRETNEKAHDIQYMLNNRHKNKDENQWLKVNLPDEEALKALIGARSGFCKTRNVLLRPLLTQVTTSLLM